MTGSSDVVVIGTGVGGLSAAIRLARQGRRVVVFEQNAQVGGKMGEFVQAGFRWDTGPSVITMRPVLEALFAAAGRRLDDYLTLIPIDPVTRYIYPDGAQIDVSRDLARTVAQIAARAPRDVEGYLAFLAYAAQQHRITAPVFTFGPPPSLTSLSRVSLRDALRVDAFCTLEAAIRRYVHSPYLRQIFGRFATYVGASPYLAPATLSVIAHIELTEGVWYPRGGVYSIARALERLATELGVEIRTNCPVRRIAITNGAASGVILADDSLVAAQTVIANVDVATVYARLLAPGDSAPQQVARIAQMEVSSSGFGLLLGVEGEHPQLAHHNIFFSSNYPREFDQIFRQGIPPEEPTVYIAITSKTDPEHAPPGCENWFVLVNAPPLGPGFDWTVQQKPYRDRVLQRLADFGYDVRDRIRAEAMFTPLDLERLTGAWRGALYGASLNHWLSPFRRPPNRSSWVRGLYFVGGATHPGGGVPLAALSGQLAAEMALAG
jgi:phytoene desaturase